MHTSQQSDWRATILVQAQLVDAKATRPFPFPQEKEGKGSTTPNYFWSPHQIHVIYVHWTTVAMRSQAVVVVPSLLL
jgi:hypothetical protein